MPEIFINLTNANVAIIYVAFKLTVIRLRIIYITHISRFLAILLLLSHFLKSLSLFLSLVLSPPISLSLSLSIYISLSLINIPLSPSIALISLSFSPSISQIKKCAIVLTKIKIQEWLFNL